MTEALRTVIFVAVALVLGVVAYFTQPKLTAPITQELVGKILFGEFDDPAAAASLKIIRYNDELGQLHEFEVSRNKSGLWSIPSHSDYPADGEDQMKKAALCLVGLKVLGLVTVDPREHEVFGVMEPNQEELKLGSTGVGLLVSFQDDKGKDLAGLVVGKQVKDAEDQRFVRVQGQDPVYAVAFDPDQLSTKFEDWIETDLLKLNTYDVARVMTNDYSLVPTQGGGLLPEKRFDATVVYNSTDSKWELNKLVNYRRQKGSLTQFDAIPTELSDSEELNATNLNDLKTALGDLKIVDVRRKPKGLSADLTAGVDFLDEQETMQSLVRLGFYPVRGAGPGGNPELLSANGEVRVLMKEGHEYVLRFGNMARSEDSSTDGQVNRYLFVTTRVDYSQFPRPELEDLPQAPASGAAPTPGCDDQDVEQEVPAEEAPDDTTEADTTEAAKSADTHAEDAPQAEAAQSDEAKPEEVGTESEAAASDDSSDAPAATDEEEAQSKLAAEQARVTKENQRKLDEWNEKKRTADEKVRELNGRFADWYYVISEDVYKKIHLSRTDLIRETEEAKEEGFGVDAFRELQKKGLPDAADSSERP